MGEPGPSESSSSASSKPSVPSPSTKPPSVPSIPSLSSQSPKSPPDQTLMSTTTPTTSVGAPSAYYRIDPLQGDNWPHWKRRVTAVLRERALLPYVMGPDYVARPAVTNADKPNEEEARALSEWDRKDGQARTQLELSIGDSEMIHLLLAKTAKEMWDALVAAKESRGTMGVLALRRRFFRSTMEEGTEMVTHVAALRQIQSDIHLMGELVNDKEFLAVLTTSLPESWDTFVQAYFGATNGVTKDTDGGTKKITSQELSAILIDEDRRRRERGGNDHAMAFRRNQRNYNAPNNKKKEGTCHNCRKAGHFKAECWSKGGGEEGQNPRKKDQNRGVRPRRRSEGWY